MYLILVAFPQSRWVVTDVADVLLWQGLFSESHTVAMLPAQALLTLGRKESKEEKSNTNLSEGGCDMGITIMKEVLSLIFFYDRKTGILSSPVS